MIEKRLPSPALVVAVLALFVSLGGTAVAAGMVPLAKRALTADSAKRATTAKQADTARRAGDAASIGGKSATQLVTEAAAAPGPASSVSALVTMRPRDYILGADQFGSFTTRCEAGEKAIGGGYQSDGFVVSADSYPDPGGGWTVGLLNIDDAAATVKVWVVCVK